jgi:hypothetical protein
MGVCVGQEELVDAEAALIPIADVCCLTLTIKRNHQLT